MELARPDAKLTPAEKRAMAQKNEAAKIRRKYKKDVHKHVKLLPVEQQYVGHMVVVLKVAGYSRTQIAKIAGVSKGQVKTYLEDPQITEMIEVLRANLPAAAIDLMQGYLLEGVLVLVEVMRSESDAAVRIKAVQELFDRGGLPKSSRQERHDLVEERTTFFDDGIVDRLREAPVEVQEQAAQMIEEFNKLLTQHADSASMEDDEAPE
jgi:hypothetical protein